MRRSQKERRSRLPTSFTPKGKNVVRQYFAQRCHGGRNPLRVGVIAAGSIYYLQDEGYLRHPTTETPVLRTPWIVESFLNGVCHAARFDRGGRCWIDKTMSGRSDMAVVRSLRDGRHKQVAVRVLQLHDDLGLCHEPTHYPSLPNLRFYRRRAHAGLRCAA